jgi:hypothetical protein
MLSFLWTSIVYGHSKWKQTSMKDLLAIITITSIPIFIVLLCCITLNMIWCMWVPLHHEFIMQKEKYLDQKVWFQLNFSCTSSLKCLGFMVPTHTHTHTHTYIYIYPAGIMGFLFIYLFIYLFFACAICGGLELGVPQNNHPRGRGAVISRTPGSLGRYPTTLKNSHTGFVVSTFEHTNLALVSSTSKFHTC